MDKLGIDERNPMERAAWAQAEQIYNDCVPPRAHFGATSMRITEAIVKAHRTGGVEALRKAAKEFDSWCIDSRAVRELRRMADELEGK